MQGRVGLLDTDVMPIFHNHCLRYCHNFALFYQLLDSNLFTHRNTYAILREATSETYGPGSIFHHISFWSTILQSFTFGSINQKYQKYVLYLLFSFIYLYQISLLQVTVKGLTTPLLRWGKVCLIRWFVRCLLLDWYLGSQTKGNTYLYFVA